LTIRCIFLILLLLASRFNFAQVNFDGFTVPDSIQVQLDTASIKDHPQLLYQWGNAMFQILPDSALPYYEIGLSQARINKNPKMIMKGLYFIGYTWRYLGNEDSVFSYYTQWLSTAKEINDSSAISSSLDKLADFYYDSSRYDLSLNYYHLALDFIPKKDLSQRHYFNYMLSLQHLMTGGLDSAIYFQLKTIDLADQTQDQLMVGRSHWQMALIYKKNDKLSEALRHFKKTTESLKGQVKFSDLYNASKLMTASTYVAMEELDSASIFFDQLSSDSTYMNSNQVFGFYLHYAALLERRNMFEEAIDYLYLSNESMKNSFNMKTAYVRNNFQLGKIYMRLSRLDSAERYLKEVVNWYEQNNNTANLLEAYDSLANTYYRQSKFRKAFDMQEKLISMADSLDRLETDKNLQELNAKYEATERQNKILAQQIELEAQASENKMLVGGLLALLLVIGLIARSRFLKSQHNKSLEAKNEEIQKLEQLKTRWFTNIAHELRTPLTLVRGPIEKVLKEENVNAVGREDLLVASRNSRQLQSTVSEILDISKLEEGQLVISTKPTNLTRLVKSSIAAFDSLAKQRDIRLQAEVYLDIYAEVDESKLSKTLLNLIMNSFRFTPDGGSISANLSVGEDIQFQVCDTGSGISEADLPFVFDRFFQTNDKITRAQSGGIGVGLSLTKEIVTMHGGQITVVSEPDVQTIFTIRLPKSLIRDGAVDGGEPIVPEEESADAVVANFSISSGKPVILLVEDNPDMRQYMRSLLRNDYNLVEASHGVEALSILEKSSVDLILSDVMMPQMDGISFAQEVKNQPECAGIPFITVTALANEEDKVFTLQIGVDDYLYKPFNPEELKVRVKNLLGNYQKRKEADPEPGFDNELVIKLRELVNSKIKDGNLSASSLADEANMSDRNLRRHLKSITGLTPIQFIHEIRLIRALELLERKKYRTLNEVSNAVGINRTSHFSELFERRFGKRPSEYLI